MHISETKLRLLLKPLCFFPQKLNCVEVRTSFWNCLNITFNVTIMRFIITKVCVQKAICNLALHNRIVFGFYTLCN